MRANEYSAAKYVLILALVYVLIGIYALLVGCARPSKKTSYELPINSGVTLTKLEYDGTSMPEPSEKGKAEKKAAFLAKWGMK